MPLSLWFDVKSFLFVLFIMPFLTRSHSIILFYPCNHSPFTMCCVCMFTITVHPHSPLTRPDLTWPDLTSTSYLYPFPSQHRSLTMIIIIFWHDNYAVHLCMWDCIILLFNWSTHLQISNPFPYMKIENKWINKFVIQQKCSDWCFNLHHVRTCPHLSNIPYIPPLPAYILYNNNNNDTTNDPTDDDLSDHDEVTGSVTFDSSLSFTLPFSVAGLHSTRTFGDFAITPPPPEFRVGYSGNWHCSCCICFAHCTVHVHVC